MRQARVSRQELGQNSKYVIGSALPHGIRNESAQSRIFNANDAGKNHVEKS